MESSCFWRLSVFLCLLIFHRCTFADPPAFEASNEYSSGKLGLYPELKFESTALKAPQVNIDKWDPRCASDEHFLFAPRGLLVGPVGPVILDRDGHMVWHREEFGVTYGLMVQKYKGEDVLTFWSGDDMVVGHGSGFYYMYDKHYRLVHKIAAGNNLMGDLHEFKITSTDTALLTSYEKKTAHLGYFNREDRQEGWIYDCIFQEIDIETSKVIFEWRATDYFGFEDCFNPLRDAGTEENAFDYFHINSVDKDNRGNYIISARYSHAVTCISGATGEILWHLGGKNNSFADQSHGRATDISWQHDARWQDGYTTISIFDNAAYFGDNDDPARGLIVAVDTKTMTAKIVHEYIHPQGYIAESQGNMQILPNKHAFLGFGSAPVFSEFSEDGELLCDIAFGALYAGADGAFSPGAVMSYRAYKQNWTGFPLHDPRVKFTRGKLFVSWNGATEVRSWGLERSVGLGLYGPKSKSPWEIVEKVPWMGFESEISVREGMDPAFDSEHLVYRLTALDIDDNILGSWIVETDGTIRSDVLLEIARYQGGASLLSIAIFATFVTLALAKRREMGSWFNMIWQRRPDQPLLRYEVLAHGDLKLPGN